MAVFCSVLSSSAHAKAGTPLWACGHPQQSTLFQGICTTYQGRQVRSYPFFFLEMRKLRPKGSQ
jgi:hypothetical protein